jgi:hypothetical protein
MLFPCKILRRKDISNVGLCFYYTSVRDVIESIIKGDFEGMLLARTIRYAIERQGLMLKLQKAFSQMKLLSRFLPICASCKKIRDDKGYWNLVEQYMTEHSDAQFSHGICPDCMRKLYPDFSDKILECSKNKDK